MEEGQGQIIIHTKRPKLKPMMTLLAMERAASSRSPRRPAKATVTTFMLKEANLPKMEGPAMCHNFFDSTHTLLVNFSSLSIPPPLLASSFDRTSAASGVSCAING
ncbi:hypothetical protein Ancab_036475 [Ancistrocladus abbreviatus]